MFTVVLTAHGGWNGGNGGASTKNDWNEMKGSVPFIFSLSKNTGITCSLANRRYCMQGSTIQSLGDIAYKIAQTPSPPLSLRVIPTHTVMSNVMLFYTIKIPVCVLNVCLLFYRCLWSAVAVAVAAVAAVVVVSCFLFISLVCTSAIGGIMPPTQVIWGVATNRRRLMYVDGGAEMGVLRRCRDYAIRICKKCLLFIFFVKFCCRRRRRRRCCWFFSLHFPFGLSLN